MIKKTTLKKLALSITFLALLSCNNKTTTKDNNIVDINIDFEKTEQCKLNDIFNLDVIKLELTEESTIMNVDKVIIKDESIYLFDRRAKSLLLFNLNGDFKHKIGRSGKGPGEYADIKDFDVKDNHIYVLSRADNKIIAYNLAGKFESEINLSEHGGYALKSYGNNSFMTISSTSLLSANFWSNSGQKVNSTSMPEYEYQRNISQKAISSYSDDICFVSTVYNDTIYTLANNNRLDPAYIIDFGKDGYPKTNNRDQFNEVRKSQKYNSLISFANIKDFIFLSIVRGKTLCLGIYDKDKDKAFTTKRRRYERYPLGRIVGELSDGVIFSTESFILDKMLRKEIESVHPTLKDIDGEDNPYLFILKTK